MNSRAHSLVAGSAIGLAVLLIAYKLLLGMPFDPGTTLVAAALIIAGLVYKVGQSQMLSPKVLTFLHVTVWALLFVGIPYGFPVSTYLAGVSLLGAVFSSWLLPLGILLMFIASVVVFLRKRNIYVANFLIFSSALLGFQVVGLWIMASL